MKKVILVSVLILIVSACGGEKAQDSNKNATDTAANTTTKKVAESTDAKATTAIDAELKTNIESAKKTTKAFGGALKAELKKAMKAGGPLNALTVCNTEAMPITTRVAKEQGATLSRVSLKNRNPDNVPNDWQKEVLEGFDTRFAEGEDVKKMAFAKIVENDGKKQFRFMKALPTGGKCLECHGTEIDADVSAKLAELYPDDKATGYQKGQVRGAIVIVKDLN